ncbi:MAG: Grx4 family monothiol glutaredoxin [Thermoanaerobaculales bacterium]|nr:Grx4 family monothiol glutaredoxin [Thermoanaerobaculales bacterium]
MSHEFNPFRLAGDPAGPGFQGAPVVETDRSAPALERVERMIASSEVFLFMKGVPDQPRCGFSANTVAVLESIGVPYATFDVLSDEAIRDAAKRRAGWPTFPQLWVRGELVGGNDIVVEMLHAGELEPLLRGRAS